MYWMSAALTAITCYSTLFLVPKTIYNWGKYSPPIERNLRRPLVTLPSVRLTLPSRFKWSGETAPGLAWFQALSSGDLAASSSSTSLTRFPKYKSFHELPSISSTEYPPFAYTQSLKFGKYRGNIWCQFRKPWFTLRLPITWVITAHYGGLVGGVVFISTVGPQVLSLPP
ncbi:hypothetical protein MMYC01_206656 [Madurella mycetomatis]|uniref:Uncharacterized protein n=1 Tax=Madurella mycetomatis TaxID=100816 RepID=A0A175VYF1_9PEZI|nr:hypothetical protein MMYC01_206656 [Madurella mycetomatis]